MEPMEASTSKDDGQVSNVSVKTETHDETNVIEKILKICQEHDKGVTEKVLRKTMSDVDADTRAAATNKLLNEGKIELFLQGNQPLYRLKDHERNKGSDAEEKVVYSIIEEAGNKGIWLREIRNRSNLNVKLLNKVIKNMETKKIIKSIKAVNALKKKVYMLYNLEPDRAVTGGSWYSNDQDFEVEFVDILNQQCYQYLKSKAENAVVTLSGALERRKASFATSEEVLKYINELKISNVSLSVDDIETILETIIFDGLVEKTVNMVRINNEHRPINSYRALEPPIRHTGLVRAPCGVCPVMFECHEGSTISPSTCIYYNEWF